ncbi:Cytochrome c [Dichanthelium oligosanthes]|uniref:Cytochrome c n=1 Tax=Dichanthelium oligosanthes TaxID=888268 RepID=A0A1E5VYE7_9POAL|nr:Cytochrome c [Dichanthelium oligosanthes]
MASYSEVPPGNPTAGEKIFKTKCAQCHTVDKGAGHKQATLNYLAFPMQYIPGTKTVFPGLKKPQERADLIAYLKNATA